MGFHSTRVDLRLILEVKRSPQYQKIRDAIISLCPTDAWCEGTLAFTVFALTSTRGDEFGASSLMSDAVFVVSASSGILCSARLVHQAGDRVRVVDLTE